MKEVRVRFAPSPTGPLHIGGVRTALYNYLFAKKNGGKMILRIEDTDQTRFVPGAEDYIVKSLDWCGIKFDESDIVGGEYGPYRQSDRKPLYKQYSDELIAKGFAYYAFDTAEELDKYRAEAEAEKKTFIYNAESRKTLRNSLTISAEEVEKMINDGIPYTVRFKMPENYEVRMHDIIRGDIKVNTNTLDDKVLFKSDGMPTYHLANIVDDHLMKISHVIRGEEWISSVPKHIALFKACGFKVPKYAHTPQVMKIDEEDGTKRKLSKRKDPEAAVSYFVEEGFPKESLIEYLLTLLNSNFEDWRRANPKEDAFAFPFNLKKMSPSGCLFDLIKLNDVSKNVISVMNAQTVYDYISAWAEKYDEDFFKVFTADPEKSKAMVNIDRESPKPRKDIAKWSEVKDYFSYMFDEYYTPEFILPENISKEDAKAILESYIGVFDDKDDKKFIFSPCFHQ